MADPYALNEDGTAKDPAAFREALKADPAKLEAINKEPEVAEIVLGNDDGAFQELIKSVYHVRLAGRGQGARGPHSMPFCSPICPHTHCRRRRSGRSG